MENYTVEGHGPDVDGIRLGHHSAVLNGVHIKNVGTAFPSFDRGASYLYNCRITDAKKGIHFGVRTTRVHNLEINADVGISFSGRANAGTQLNGVTFNCNIGIKGTNGSDRGPVVFNYPDFTDCDTPVETQFESLHLNNPTGL